MTLDPVKEIILYTQKAIPNANFDSIEVEYVQVDDFSRSHFDIKNVIDSAGKELKLIAYYKERGQTLDDRVELWSLDYDRRLFAEML
jgi:homoserine dehydrogenase